MVPVKSQHNRFLTVADPLKHAPFRSAILSFLYLFEFYFAIPVDFQKKLFHITFLTSTVFVLIPMTMNRWPRGLMQAQRTKNVNLFVWPTVISVWALQIKVCKHWLDLSSYLRWAWQIFISCMFLQRSQTVWKENSGASQSGNVHSIRASFHF